MDNYVKIGVGCVAVNVTAGIGLAIYQDHKNRQEKEERRKQHEEESKSTAAAETSYITNLNRRNWMTSNITNLLFSF